MDRLLNIFVCSTPATDNALFSNLREGKRKPAKQFPGHLCKTEDLFAHMCKSSHCARHISNN
eukprot:6476294-Amphidinium_carterae.1